MSMLIRTQVAPSRPYSLWRFAYLAMQFRRDDEAGQDAERTFDNLVQG